MSILENLITVLLTNKVYNSLYGEKKQKETFFERVEKRVASQVPRDFLEKVKTRIGETYRQYSIEELEKGGSAAEGDRYIAEYRRLQPHQQEELKRLYGQIGGYAAWRVRLQLIQFLLSIEEEANGSVQFMLHNELLYMINNFTPSGEVQVMYQKVCCFLDAEFYFLQGDFVSALMRLYDVLNWDKLLDNPWLLDRMVSNGLEEIYIDTVVNIINIYALLGMSEKIQQMRAVFGTLYEQANAQERSLDEFDEEHGASESYRAFRSAQKRALRTNSGFVGFYSLRGEAFRDNMFDNFYNHTERGVFYLITPGFFYEVSYSNDDVCPEMQMKRYGTVSDYKEKIEKAQVELESRIFK